LVARGVIILGGPVGGDGEDLALLAVEAADEDAVRSAFEADPWTVHQVFRLKQIRPWTLWLDGRSRYAEWRTCPNRARRRASRPSSRRCKPYSKTVSRSKSNGSLIA